MPKLTVSQAEELHRLIQGVRWADEEHANAYEDATIRYREARDILSQKEADAAYDNAEEKLKIVIEKARLLEEWIADNTDGTVILARTFNH